MKFIKKLMVVILTLLLLTSCTTVKQKSDEGLKYIEALLNYKAKEKNVNNTKDNEEFEKYLDDIFIDTIAESYLYMHNNVSDYHSLNIEKPEVNWGEVEYSEEGNAEEFIDQLVKLREFDYDSLSYDQQFDYDLFEYSLLETIASCYYQKYDLLFSSGTDVLNGIVITLDEFSFYDEESIDDYIMLLKDTERYINDILNYTEAQAKNGLYTSKSSIEASVSYIDSFTSKVDNNSLIISFDNRIDKYTGALKKDKQIYKDEVRDIIKNSIIPSFLKCKEELNKYKGKATDSDLALCKLDKNYAVVNIILNTSCNDSVDTIFQDTRDVLDEMYVKFINACADESAIEEFYAVYENPSGIFVKDDKQTLSFLEEKIKNDYPSIEGVNYTLSRLDSSSASNTTVAYYVSPPLDDLSLNVIRTNPNAMGYDPLDDLCSLSHEGFPGHLYQNMYFSSFNPNRFRATQSFIGYTEGWASMAMIDALSYTTDNPNTLALYKFQVIFSYLISALVDMGVNYYGWSKKDLRNYLKDEDWGEFFTVDGLYSAAIDMPGVYLQYGVGFAEFYKLKSYAKEALGTKYIEKEYNDVVLKHGELPFVILRLAVDDYIESVE